VRLIVINQLSEYTNGTTEDTLGVANFNFRDDYDVLDFQELLVHQLVQRTASQYDRALHEQRA